MKRFTNANKLFMDKDDYYRKYQEQKEDKATYIVNTKDEKIDNLELKIKIKEARINHLQSTVGDLTEELDKSNKENKRIKRIKNMVIIFGAIFFVYYIVMLFLILR